MKGTELTRTRGYLLRLCIEPQLQFGSGLACMATPTVERLPSAFTIQAAGNHIFGV